MQAAQGRSTKPNLQKTLPLTDAKEAFRLTQRTKIKTPYLTWRRLKARLIQADIELQVKGQQVTKVLL